VGLYAVSFVLLVVVVVVSNVLSVVCETDFVVGLLVPMLPVV